MGRIQTWWLDTQRMNPMRAFAPVITVSAPRYFPTPQQCELHNLRDWEKNTEVRGRKRPSYSAINKWGKERWLRCHHMLSIQEAAWFPLTFTFMGKLIFPSFCKVYITEAPSQETYPTSRSVKWCSGFIICRLEGMTALWLFIAWGCSPIQRCY